MGLLQMMARLARCATWMLQLWEISLPACQSLFPGWIPSRCHSLAPSHPLPSLQFPWGCQRCLGVLNPWEIFPCGTRIPAHSSVRPSILPPFPPPSTCWPSNNPIGTLGTTTPSTPFLGILDNGEWCRERGE